MESEYQLVEARAAGADTALLIVALLEEKRLKQLMGVSRELGMEPLVEVANQAEMVTALQCGATFIGVNNRDLHTFSMNTNNTNQLAWVMKQYMQETGTGTEVSAAGAASSSSVLLAALSGIKTRADVQRYESSGAEAVLVGETLMKSDNPTRTIHELIGLRTTEASSNTATAAQRDGYAPLVKVCTIQCKRPWVRLVVSNKSLRMSSPLCAFVATVVIYAPHVLLTASGRYAAFVMCPVH